MNFAENNTQGVITPNDRKHNIGEYLVCTVFPDFCNYFDIEPRKDIELDKYSVFSVCDDVEKSRGQTLSSWVHGEGYDKEPDKHKTAAYIAKAICAKKPLRVISREKASEEPYAFLYDKINEAFGFFTATAQAFRGKVSDRVGFREAFFITRPYRRDFFLGLSDGKYSIEALSMLFYFIEENADLYWEKVSLEARNNALVKIKLKEGKQ